MVVVNHAQRQSGFLCGCNEFARHGRSSCDGFLAKYVYAPCEGVEHDAAPELLRHGDCNGFHVVAREHIAVIRVEIAFLQSEPLPRDFTTAWRDVRQRDQLNLAGGLQRVERRPVAVAHHVAAANQSDA